MGGGAPIVWKSTASSEAACNSKFAEMHPSLSSGEAEIYAASNATMEFLHLSYVVEEMNLPNFPKPIQLQCDASTALAFMGNTCRRSRLKHLDVRQDWVTTLRDNNIVIGKKVATNLNLADIGTKILGPIIFEGLRNQILSTISDESINREFLLSTA